MRDGAQCGVIRVALFSASVEEMRRWNTRWLSALRGSRKRSWSHPYGVYIGLRRKRSENNVGRIRQRLLRPIGVT